MFPVLRYCSAAFLRCFYNVFLGRLPPLLPSSSSPMEQHKSAGLRLLLTLPLEEEEEITGLSAAWCGGVRLIHIRSEPPVIRRFGGRAAAAPEWCVLLPVSQLPQLRRFLLAHDPEPRLGVVLGLGLGMIGMGFGGLFLLMLGLGLAFVKDNIEELKPELKKLVEEVVEDIRQNKKFAK